MCMRTCLDSHMLDDVADVRIEIENFSFEKKKIRKERSCTLYRRKKRSRDAIHCFVQAIQSSIAFFETTSCVTIIFSSPKQIKSTIQIEASKHLFFSSQSYCIFLKFCLFTAFADNYTKIMHQPLRRMHFIHC